MSADSMVNKACQEFSDHSALLVDLKSDQVISGSLAVSWRK